jgi:hypothetical protein
MAEVSEIRYVVEIDVTLWLALGVVIALCYAMAAVLDSIVAMVNRWREK